MIRSKRASAASLPTLSTPYDEAPTLQVPAPLVSRHSAPVMPSISSPEDSAANPDRAPTLVSALRPRAARRMESRQSLRLGWASLPEPDRVDGRTAPERRLQYIMRSGDRRSIWPLVNLLSASLGRSFVSLAGGLLADGVRNDMTPFQNGANATAQAFGNATVAALNVSRSALADCATVLGNALNTSTQSIDISRNATLAGAMTCLTSLEEALASTAPRSGANATSPLAQDEGPSVITHQFVPGGTLLGLGILLFTVGAGRFAWDTAKIDRRRAVLMASMSFSGFAFVVTANSVAEYALDDNKQLLNNAMLLPRLLGTYLIFSSIPKSFSTCELVRGDARLPHRELFRSQLGAWGPVVLYLWGSMLANPNVSSVVHEVLLSLALMMLIIANALSETNVARARAAARLEPQNVDEMAENEAAVARLREPMPSRAEHDASLTQLPLPQP